MGSVNPCDLYRVLTAAANSTQLVTELVVSERLVVLDATSPAMPGNLKQVFRLQHVMCAYYAYTCRTFFFTRLTVSKLLKSRICVQSV